MDFDNILIAAHAAAAAAQKGMVEDMNALDCGFAWVRIDGTEPLARHCRKVLKKAEASLPKGAPLHTRWYGSKGYPSGWQFWCPGDAPVQAVGIHEAGAKAFAIKLGEYGIRADWSSRLD